MNAQNLTQKSLEAIQTAQSMALENRNNYITPEHLLYALVDQDGGLIPSLLGKMGVDCHAVLAELDTAISAPDRDCSTDQLAAALSEYIKLFDRMMKAYVSGRLTAHEVEAAYYSQMLNSPVHI